MSSIIFECDATELDILKRKDNNENAFAINDKSLVISLIDSLSIKNEIISQTEISKENAIKLAKLILHKYGE